jgi:hypothetical protein
MALKDFFRNGSFKGNGSPGGFTPGSNSAPGADKPDPGKIANKAGAILIPVLAVLVVLKILFGSFYTLSETESAVVTTLGQAAVNNNKGLQFKIPFLQEVTKINTTVRSFEVGYMERGDGTYVNVESESTMITSDMNFVDIDFYVTYQVTDPLQYMYASEDPELILKNLVQSTIRGTVSAYTVDLFRIIESSQSIACFHMTNRNMGNPNQRLATRRSMRRVCFCASLFPGLNVSCKAPFIKPYLAPLMAVSASVPICVCTLFAASFAILVHRASSMQLPSCRVASLSPSSSFRAQ